MHGSIEQQYYLSPYCSTAAKIERRENVLVSRDVYVLFVPSLLLRESRRMHPSDIFTEPICGTGLVLEHGPYIGEEHSQKGEQKQSLHALARFQSISKKKIPAQAQAQADRDIRQV